MRSFIAAIGAALIVSASLADETETAFESVQQEYQQEGKSTGTALWL